MSYHIPRPAIHGTGTRAATIGLTKIDNIMISAEALCSAITAILYRQIIPKPGHEHVRFQGPFQLIPSTYTIQP